MRNWVFIVFFLGSTFSNLASSEGGHEKKIPSAILVGTVYCDTCFLDDFSKNSHFISGASVEVECKEGDSRPSFRKQVETDGHGEFKVKLPFSVSKHVRKIKSCSVKLLRSSEPNCAVASTATSSSLRLKARKQGTHIFSAGFFTFKPEKQPYVCNQKPQTYDKLNSKKTSIPKIPPFDPTFPPPLRDPETPFFPPNLLPPIPLLPELPPLPQLPPLPPLPGLPNLPPLPGKAGTEQKVVHPDQFGFPFPFPPNPLQPPIIPNPLQPPPLIPPLLPPNPLQPPPAPLIPLPPIPGLTPSPPPPFIPTVPTLPPLPPLPTLPPIPLLPSPPHNPGSPPTTSSPQKTSP